jgi:CRP-like cAMP-binding protein
MIASPTKETSPHPQQEDALAYLPRKGVVEYHRKQIIYDEQHPSNGLSLIIEGRVKVTTTTEHGSQVVTGIFFPDELFGEAVLLGTNREQAQTLERTLLMTWSLA